MLSGFRSRVDSMITYRQERTHTQGQLGRPIPGYWMTRHKMQCVSIGKGTGGQGGGTVGIRQKVAAGMPVDARVLGRRKAGLCLLNL